MSSVCDLLLTWQVTPLTAENDPVPIDRTSPFVPFDELVSELHGTMLPADPLEAELRELDEAPRDPFE